MQAKYDPCTANSLLIDMPYPLSRDAPGHLPSFFAFESGYDHALFRIERELESRVSIGQIETSFVTLTWIGRVKIGPTVDNVSVSPRLRPRERLAMRRRGTKVYKNMRLERGSCIKYPQQPGC